MSKLLLAAIAVALLVGSSPARRCACQKAGEHDVPHGANETIEYEETTVKSIKGRVVYSHDKSPADDAVVEVYDITPSNKLKTHEIVQQHYRRAACLTSKDGGFCFDDLPPGNYLVRAGTRSAYAGWNEVYIRVKLDLRSRSAGNITLGLQLGT